jgi:hypothetical protein
VKSLDTTKRRLRDLFQPSLRKVILVGVILAALQQVTGINTIIYYLPTLLKGAGFGSGSSLLANVGNGIVNVALTVVAIRLIDRVGRRPLLIGGLCGMTAGLLVVAIGFVVGGSHLHGAGAIVAVVAFFVLREARPEAVRLDVERKRIMDAIRMATYNAESALARLIAPHYARAEDEARSLLREIFSASADLEIDGDRLHVRIDPLSAPRRSRALAGLCQDLTATETIYPGTGLTLVYSVKAT